MPATTIRFYFDYISPNAYLAWTQLPRLAEKYGAAIEPVPVLYAGLLDAHGQLGPGEMPAKGRWMSRNNLRKAALLGVPLNPPPFFPFNPLLSLRVSVVALESARGRDLVDAFFRAVWVRGQHVSEAAVVATVAGEVGLDGGSLLERAALPEVKAQLRRQTDDALSRGVFGVPSMEVGDELFWGYDDFPYFELFLAGRDPLTATQWQHWSRPVQATAMRRRFR